MEVAVIIESLRSGLGWLRNRELKVKGEGGFPWSSRWVCHLAL